MRVRDCSHFEVDLGERPHHVTSEADKDGNHEEYPTALSQPYAPIKIHKIGARMVLGGVKVPLTNFWKHLVVNPRQPLGPASTMR